MAVPTVPAWLPGLVTVTVLAPCGLIVQVKAAVPFAPVVSVTVTVTLNGLPVVVVGVPVISPVEELIARPVGRLAAVPTVPAWLAGWVTVMTLPVPFGLIVQLRLTEDAPLPSLAVRVVR